jgi:hypothetical protein
MNWNAVVNVPFSSKWAARFAVEKQRHDAYLSDGSGTGNKFGTRGKLSYKSRDKLSFLLTADYSWDTSLVANSLPVPGSAGNLNTRMPRVSDFDVSAGWAVPFGGDAWTKTNGIQHLRAITDTSCITSGRLGYEHVFTLEDGATITPRLQTKISTGFWTNHEEQLPGAWQGHYRMSDFYLTYAS